MNFRKRLFDLVFTIPGFIALLPVLALVALAIKLDDGGPALFRQVRVGRDGKTFRMLKFRSMVVDAPKLGQAITVGADPRITRVGRWLRRSKLDELPQLWNVLRGEMSLVGPRPEVPEFVELYDETQRTVLRLTPGITDPASMAYRNEAELLAAADDPRSMYVREIMPAKIAMNLDYAARATLWSDFSVVVRTVLGQ